MPSTPRVPKKEGYFRINQNWSVFSDWIPSTRKEGDGFDVVTIQSEWPDKEGSQKTYKMNVPIREIKTIHFLLKEAVKNYEEPEKPNHEWLEMCQTEKGGFDFTMIENGGFRNGRYLAHPNYEGID